MEKWKGQTATIMASVGGRYQQREELAAAGVGAARWAVKRAAK